MSRDEALHNIIRSLILDGGRADPRWIEVGVMLAKGKTNTQISTDLFLGKRTVSTYISKLCAATGSNSWRELSGRIVECLMS
jgi:DNA-binding NarL/FixJ family response regulator